MFSKILLPVDEPGTADAVVAPVIELSRALQATVTVLHVAESANEPASMGRLEPFAERLGPTLTTLTNAGIQTDYEIAFGEPAAKIVASASRLGCDLIAMATNARGAIQRAFLGSVTDEVVHTASVPTLTINPTAAGPWTGVSNVLVPLDGSELAETALPHAERLAAALSVDLMLVRVVHVPLVVAAGIDSYPYSGMTDIEAEAEVEATAYLTQVTRGLAAKGIKVTRSLQRGPIAPAIVDLARKRDSSIVVLASRGRTGAKRLWLGSVAEGVIRESGAPVLVVKAGDAEA